MAKRPANTGEKMVNVPRSVQDEFYRYKMPALRVKVEGKGNGIKTVIENMADIAKAIERRPDYPTKYFGLELGALTKSTDKYIVNGRHDPEDLAKLLDIFIEKYVLCGKCHNPETNMIIRGDNIGLVCRACGATTPVDPIHRLSTYILKYPPTTDRKKPTGKAGKKQEKSDRKAKAEAQEQVVDDNNDDDWCVDTSKEAVEARRRETLGNNERLSDANNAEDEKEEAAGTAPPTEDANQQPATDFKLEVKPNQNPVPVLQEYWKRDPPLEQILSQIKQLQGSHSWSEPTLIKSIFGSLFDENVKKNFYKKAEILRLFVPTIKEQRIVLLCIEKLCEMYPSIIDNLASIMNGFYEEEILDEEILDKWYRNPNPKFDPNLSNKIREKTKVFIDWLKNAETEDSDEL